MKTFKEFLNEGETRTASMSTLDMKAHLGNTKFSTIIKHPWFKDYFADKTVAMQHHKTDTGLETVDVAHGGIGDDKLKRKVSFQLSRTGRKIDNAHLYHNKNDERHNGGIVWRHVKTEKEV